jgi:hypothetical protein
MITVRVPIGFDRVSIKEKLVAIKAIAASQNEILLDKMLFLIMEIYRTSMRCYFIEEFDSKMAPLKADILKKNIGYEGNIKYNDVIDWLKLTGLIVVDNHYVQNFHSRHYGLAGVKKHEMVGEQLIKWQPKEQKRKNIETAKIFDSILLNLSAIDLDHEYLDLVLLNEPNRLRKEYLTYCIYPFKTGKKEDFYASIDDYGRLHHNLTGFSRDIRPAVSINGKIISSIDLSGSQLYFSLKGFISYLKQVYGNSNLDYIFTIRPDCERFINCVLEGQFYEEINTYLNYSLEDLKSNKVNILMPIFGKEQKKRKTQFYKAFEELFPTFLRYINKLKEKGYKTVAQDLQRKESSVMINKVSKRLVDEGIWFLPIHDCILATEDNEELVNKIILEECQSTTGMVPHVKISAWSKPKLDLPSQITADERGAFQLKNILSYPLEVKARKRKRMLNDIKNGKFNK